MGGAESCRHRTSPALVRTVPIPGAVRTPAASMAWQKEQQLLQQVDRGSCPQLTTAWLGDLGGALDHL